MFLKMQGFLADAASQALQVFFKNFGAQRSMPVERDLVQVHGFHGRFTERPAHK
jgi:alkylation response protein AidB-like acyl-CoA dehydrogenase